MTLQLVLPHDDGEQVKLSAEFEVFWRFFISDNSGVHYRQRSRPTSRPASIIESKSPGFINTRLVNYNRGVSYAPSMRSQSQSQYHSEPEHIPPPTSQLEKTKMTKRYFATITAITYAIFLVIFGAIVFVGTAVEDRTEYSFYPAAEVS